MRQHRLTFLLLFAYASGQEGTLRSTKSHPATGTRAMIESMEVSTRGMTKSPRPDWTTTRPNVSASETIASKQVFGNKTSDILQKTAAFHSVSTIENHLEKRLETVEAVTLTSIFLLNESEDVTDSTLVNNTTASFNGTESISAGLPMWLEVFNLVQLVCTFTGFASNILTIITLYVSPSGFSRLILILFRHQSFVDSMVCAMAFILMLQPYNWLTGNKYIDIFICHAWHSQAIYWGAVFVSTYNLVLISFERFLAVLYPFKHSKLVGLSRKKVFMWFTFMHVLSVLATHGSYIQTRLKDDVCLSEYAFDGPLMKSFFYGYVIFSYIITYFIPAVVMATVYGIISRKLHIRNKDSQLGQSNVVERAGSQVTKTAITVTVIFIVTIGYDINYYLLGHVGAIDYQLNTPYQKVGVFLSNMNSCANPFVYAILMPVFRLSMARTFCCKKARSTSRNSESRTGENVSSRTTMSVSTIAGDVINTKL